MCAAVLIFLFCIATGACIEQRTIVNKPFLRLMLVVSAACGQLLLSVQLLSLIKALTPGRLFLANLGLTILAGPSLLMLLPKRVERHPWSKIIRQIMDAANELKRDKMCVVILLFSIFCLGTACLIGWLMIPFGDSYHHEMPLFWIQNKSILPFPIHNPRVISLAFLTEAVALPGYMYAHDPSVAAILTLVGTVLAMGAVFSLSTKLGTSLHAAGCAAALVPGYGVMMLALLDASSSGLFAAAWVGASLICLIDLNQATEPDYTELALSALFFTMACGAKNSTLLFAPFYAVILTIVMIKWRWFQRQRASVVLCITILIGVACSGVGWNYVTNKLWFGGGAGSVTTSETLSRDFRPRAMWTRISRGLVSLALDVEWVPSTMSARYDQVCQKAVGILGGCKDLPEDNEFYRFSGFGIAPRRALGLLGIIVFIPGIAMATLKSMRKNLPATISEQSLFAMRVLVAFTTGSFLLCHLLLRWQSIGLLRLLFPLVISGASVCALILRSKWFRSLGLITLLVSNFIFLGLMLGLLGRRLDAKESRGLTLLSSFGRPHSATAVAKQPGKPERLLQIREDYSNRELCKEALKAVVESSVIGVVGDANTDCVFLFGPRFKNRIIPLVDCRNPGVIVNPYCRLDYVAVLSDFNQAKSWAVSHGFSKILEISTGSSCRLLLFQNQGISRTADSILRPQWRRLGFDTVIEGVQ